MRLRDFAPEDAEAICGWIRSEKELYRWSADRLGQYPLLPETLRQHYAPKTGRDFIPLTMCTDDGQPAGHLFLRYPDPADRSTVRLGFVIVAPAYRGKGYGKMLVQLACRYAAEKLHAEKATLGVFTENLPALYCYRAAGFRETGETASIVIDGQIWECAEMCVTGGGQCPPPLI